MADPKPLTRDQLAKFLPDAEAIKRFERLFTVSGELTPNDIKILYQLTQEASIDAGIANTKATEALDALNRIADSLDLIANAPTDVNDNSIKTDYIDFLPSPSANVPARAHWGTTGTLEVDMSGIDVTQQVGDDFFVYGRASAAINKGQVAMVTGAVGASNVITFSPSIVSLANPNAIIGIATENIALNGFGRVKMAGAIRNINTTGAPVGQVWVDGDVLWYNTAVVGGLTKVKPTNPALQTQVAIVTSVNATTGSVRVDIIHGTAGLVAGETNAAPSKATPADADEIPLADSATGFSLKKLTWANLKATLATWINGGTFPAFFTSLNVTGNSTLGSAAASRSVVVNGINSGANGGANLQIQNNGVPIIGIGNKSNLAGGAYNATPVIYGNPSLEFNLGGTAYGTMTATLFNYAVAITSGGLITGGSTTLMASSATLANGAGAAVGTLTNAPVAGNPTKWVQIVDNGVTRNIPTW